MTATIDVESLYATLGLPGGSVLIDVRAAENFGDDARLIPGAWRRDAGAVDAWSRTLPAGSMIGVFDKSGEGSSREICARLAKSGHDARAVAGGVGAWISAGHATVKVRTELTTPGGSRWITRERPKIDRLACPWLIRRFIDPEAQFFYSPSHRVRSDGKAIGAEPYDIADVTFSHRGSQCSFDAFLDEFDLRDPVLNELADIVRAADTGALAQSREAPGLLAISLGLSNNIADDVLLLEQGMIIYDALYAWRKSAAHETHSWPQFAS